MREGFMSSGYSVLIVEDDKDLANATRVVLESKKFKVRTANNGKEGIQALKDEKPDVLILDVMMTTPTEGFDLAHYLKDNPEYKDIPIIMVTGFPQQMAEMGPEKFQNILGDDWPAARFFEKPMDIEKLAVAVGEVLKEVGKA